MGRPTIALVVALVFATAASALASAEFIRRDRWVNMGWQFQYGYEMGVIDTLQVLNWVSITQIQAADDCASQFTTVRAARTFFDTVMAHEPAKAHVATSVFYALVNCLASYQLPDNMRISLETVTSTYAWQDPWERHRSDATLLLDGYATGTIDIIRHLDNIGTSPQVLLSDVHKATSCIDQKNLRTVGNLHAYLRHAIDQQDSPLASTSGAIFDGLKICRWPTWPFF